MNFGWVCHERSNRQLGEKTTCDRRLLTCSRYCWCTSSDLCRSGWDWEADFVILMCLDSLVLRLPCSGMQTPDSLHVHVVYKNGVLVCEGRSGNDTCSSLSIYIVAERNHVCHTATATTRGGRKKPRIDIHYFSRWGTVMAIFIVLKTTVCYCTHWISYLSLQPLNLSWGRLRTCRQLTQHSQPTGRRWRQTSLRDWVSRDSGITTVAKVQRSISHSIICDLVLFPGISNTPGNEANLWSHSNHGYATYCAVAFFSTWWFKPSDPSAFG